MSSIKMFFVIIVGLIGVPVSAYQQTVDKSSGRISLMFPNGSEKLTPKIKEQLRSIGREISISAEPSFSIVCYNRANQSNLSWVRGYYVMSFLIDSVSVPAQKLRLLADIVGKPNLVLIRVSTKEERSGTNCGVPRMPDIK